MILHLCCRPKQIVRLQAGGCTRLIERVGEIGDIFKLNKEELSEILFQQGNARGHNQSCTTDWAQKEIDWARANEVQTLYN